MLTATEFATGAKVIVNPIAIYRPNAAHETLLIADKTTGRGVWFDTNDREWYINLQGVDSNLRNDAEVIEGVYGADEEEWEAAANRKLAAYGLKLGDFDEKAGDCYTLLVEEGLSAASLEDVTFRA